MFLTLTASTANAFDIEDYATTYRATRDAYIKAHNEMVIGQLELSPVIKQFRAIQPVMTEFGSSQTKISSCSGALDAYKARRNSQQVLKELGDLLKNPMLESLQSTTRMQADSSYKQAELDNLLVSVREYYSRLNPSIDEATDVFREPTTYAASTDTIFQAEFDREDFATSFRARRDVWLKALNEVRLAFGPYIAAKNAMMVAERSYLNYLDCADNIGLAPSLEETLLRQSSF